jgi:citronellol/citronellal dehydrogenase
MTTSLAGKTLLISGGSRGIGLAIALRAARDGANIALLAKTSEPDPKLPGTIYTAAAEIEAAGGQALPIVGDVRHDDTVYGAVERTVATFRGIDIVVNNASAIDRSGTDTLPMKRYDLMQDINGRGTFLFTKTALPYLRKADNPHVLTLSPPLNLNPRWAAPHLGYTIAKYAMSLCTLGWAEEFATDGIAANSLWPQTVVATAVANLAGDDALRKARKPEIMADAAHAILVQDSRTCTGNFFIDEEVLRTAGVQDLSVYGGEEGLAADIFLDSALDAP